MYASLGLGAFAAHAQRKPLVQWFCPAGHLVTNGPAYIENDETLDTELFFSHSGRQDGDAGQD